MTMVLYGKIEPRDRNNNYSVYRILLACVYEYIMVIILLQPLLSKSNLFSRVVVSYYQYLVMKRLTHIACFWCSLFTRIAGINPLESQRLVGLMPGTMP